MGNVEEIFLILFPRIVSMLLYNESNTEALQILLTFMLLSFVTDI